MECRVRLRVLVLVGLAIPGLAQPAELRDEPFDETVFDDKVFDDKAFDDLHSHLGPARDFVVLGFPYEILQSSLSLKPMFGVEFRFAVGEGWAVAVQPVGVWYVAGGAADVDGGGFGLIVSGHYYFDRSLAGGFVAVQTGDIEAFIAGENGRTVGGSAIFGYAISSPDSGSHVSLGLGFGYWHTMGVVAGGVSLPEILSLRLGIGWGWSFGLVDEPKVEGYGPDR